MHRVAVIGLGRAGRARSRALDAHPRAELVAAVRREPGSGEPGFDDVVADPGIDAAIVCTPNLLHPPQVRALLEAGKHVAVEFPLAPSVAEARELFDLARSRGRVLHVEHIELLSASQRAQRQRVVTLGPPNGGELRFGAASDGWIGDARLAGSPALCAVARLHRLVDLWGEARIRDAAIDREPDGYRLYARLLFKDGDTSLFEARAPGLERQTVWAIPCRSGPLEDPPVVAPGDLFREDLDCFLDRIEGHGRAYVSEQRILHVLDLVEQIERRAPRPA